MHSATTSRYCIVNKLYYKQYRSIFSLLDAYKLLPHFCSPSPRAFHVFFFLKDTAPTEIYPLPLHAALPISSARRPAESPAGSPALARPPHVVAVRPTFAKENVRRGRPIQPSRALPRLFGGAPLC